MIAMELKFNCPPLIVVFLAAFKKLEIYWGGMVRLGADTFWELYNPENADESPYGGTIVNSYCHAWSCGPAYFLRKYFKMKEE